MALTIEHPRGCRWDVNRDGDLVGVVIGKYDIGFLVMDREGSFIGNYCSLTKAFLAVARDDEVRTLETIWSLS